MKDQLWEGPVHNAAIPMGAVSASFKPLIFIAESSAAITRAILIVTYNLWKCRIRALLQRSVSSLSLVTRCCQARGNSGKVTRTRHSNFEPVLPEIICASLAMVQSRSFLLRKVTGKPQLTLPGEPWEFCREE